MTGCRYLASSGNLLQQTQEGWLFPFILSLFFVLWIGMRPVSGAFGDTVNYALGYATMKPDIVEIDWHSEWIWQWLTMGCKKAGLNVHWYFTLVEAGYIISVGVAVKKISSYSSNDRYAVCLGFFNVFYFWNQWLAQRIGLPFDFISNGSFI